MLLLLIAQDGGPFQALLLASAYLVINFVLGNLIEPRVMGQALGLSTFVAFLSLVVWGWIFGAAGMLLSVVLTMTLKIALDSHPQTRWIARLLGPGRQRLKGARRAIQNCRRGSAEVKIGSSENITADRVGGFCRLAAFIKRFVR
ncbi:hypothetical protein HSBAA_41990 [Vreelandella sulfidaeris]|uniref:Uncharacterized protein n=1 Tax=Vreelandella sulfidaeris TaxID=115553 RepID=A0A455UC77_9GAMM|nr:hypothetical protein HSBAA_41990 [Halomonas sulfidaeris]